MCSTRNHTVKLQELFIVIRHQIFFNILWLKTSIFFQYFFSIEENRLREAEVVYNINFVLFFAARYVISERADSVDTSFPNVRLRHFRTC